VAKEKTVHKLQVLAGVFFGMGLAYFVGARQHGQRMGEPGGGDRLAMLFFLLGVGIFVFDWFWNRRSSPDRDS
jgi:hypothetical protein